MHDCSDWLLVLMGDSTEFNLAGLQNYDGVDGKPIYVAILGIVYDVTESRSFYGPGGPYHLLAGHDASYALAEMKLDVEYLDRDTSTMSEKHSCALRSWVAKFESKYPRIGVITSPGVVHSSGNRKGILSSSHKVTQDESDCHDPVPDHLSLSTQTEVARVHTSPQVPSGPMKAIDRCPLGFGAKGSAEEVPGRGRKCPLGFGSSAPPPPTSLERPSEEFTLAQLRALREEYVRDQEFKLKSGRAEVNVDLAADVEVVTEGVKCVGGDQGEERRKSKARTEQAGRLLISLKGVVYDVATDPSFAPGGRLHFATGHDASVVFALGHGLSLDPPPPHTHQPVAAPSSLLDASLQPNPSVSPHQPQRPSEPHPEHQPQPQPPQPALRFEDVRRLEQVCRLFEAHYPLVGRLCAPDAALVLGAEAGVGGGFPFHRSTPEAAIGQATAAAAAAAEIHALVESGQGGEGEKGGDGEERGEGALEAEGVCVGDTGIEKELRRLIGLDGVGVDVACPRTGLTPLLKAVEIGNLSLCRLLLKLGADSSLKAQLYDDDTALELARRFQHSAIVTLLESEAP